MEIAFLFGAGIANTVGMDKTADLTKKIMGIKNSVEPFADKISILLNYVLNTLNKYYENDQREVNYEDIYYILNLLKEDEVGQTENPPVELYKEKILNDIPGLLDESKYSSEIDFNSLISKSLSYIETVVCENLTNVPKDLSKLNVLKEIQEYEKFENIFIFTLNHDRVLEAYFDSLNVEYNDWFSKPVNNIRYWDTKQNIKRISLFKLHGSVDWFIIPSNKPIDDYNLKPIIKNKLRDGNEVRFLLIGTFNKINKYSGGISFELQTMFHKYLAKVERLVISGYSFGDQGINNRIIDWFYNDKNRNIIVVHPNLEELKKQVRPAVFTMWNDWEERKFITIEKGIEKLTLEDILIKL